MQIGDAIRQAVTGASKDWTRVKKRELRATGSRAREHYYQGRVRERSIKDIAFNVMQTAYAKASGGGTLPAHARQIMYQARPLILAQTDKTLGKDFDQYFTQQLLPAYVMEHRPDTAGWDVVFDARGHFQEPHTDHEVALGTLSVRSYLGQVTRDCVGIPSAVEPHPVTYPTHGPVGRFQTVLFIEKEGFLPLLQQAQIAERFDLAIMSTKGLASTAARTLIERLEGVRFLVLHDFDKAGFSIVGTLTRDTWRYQFRRRPDVVDLGLRLADVETEHLTSEPVTYREDNPKANLMRNGATREEVAFLVGHGQRVELNAFASDQFIQWLEQKLTAHGVTKFVPDDARLADAYRRAVYLHALNAALEESHDHARDTAEASVVPENLAQQVRTALVENPRQPWDQVVADLAEGL